jgi:hypothetical protein
VIVAREVSRTEINHEALFNHTVEFEGPDGPVRFNHRGALLPEGHEVSVRYDPENPTLAVVDGVEMVAGA